MDKSIILQYKKAVEQNFRNIKMRGMLKEHPYKISEDQTDGNPLPFVSNYLRAEEALINEIELGEVKEKEIDFLMKVINENEVPQTSYPYLSFAANEIYLGMQGLKERLTGMRGIEKKTKDKSDVIKKANPIRSELEMLLPKMEEKIKDKLNDKIWRAAYSEYLFKNNYFEKKINRIKTCNGFAKSKWREDITNQLSGTCKVDRENHIKTLTIRFRNLQV